MSDTTGPAPPPRKDTSPQGNTRPSRLQQPKPRLPHERDSSSDSQSGTQHPEIEQAARDLEKGLQDTGRGPVVNRLARAHFPSRQDAGDEEKPGEDTARSPHSRGKR